MKNEHPTLRSLGTENPVLQSVSAHGRLEGLLLSMRLRQSFCNASSDNMEVIYTFPLAWGSVLLELHATLGGKRMTGQVMARAEAHERYEQAVENGDAPVMVQKATANLFSASLGSLKPGEEATIELSYAQLLSFEQERIRLVVPTTIAPRYGDPLAQAGLAPDQVSAPSLLAQHRFCLSLTLCGAVAQARIGSPTHRITQQRSADTVTVELQDQAWLDRDCVLLLEGLEGRSFALAGPDERSGPGHAAVVASYCPPALAQHAHPLRLKILVDCSGSMAGDSMVQARHALQSLAGALTPHDQASYSRFGSQTQRVLGVFPGTPHQVQLLRDAVHNTGASLGGTEMASALQDTFALHMGPAHHADEADVLLITDGDVWDAQRIVDEAQRSGHRIYALGVGSAPAESLLREMAEATAGACEFVSPRENMTAAIERLLARIRLAMPVQARLASLSETRWCSPMPRRIAAGETVHLFMRLPALPSQAPVLQIDGQQAGTQQTTPAELTTRQDDLVARLVAAREIAQTADRKAAAQMAERYQLVTDETNLLLVIEREQTDKTDGMPALHTVPPMLAAGWGGSARVFEPKEQRMYSRATPSLKVMSMSVARSSPPSGDPSLTCARKWPTAQPDVNRPTPAPVAAVELEIPAFLRRSSLATPEEIVAAFNQAAEQGQGFRQTLRAVTELSFDSHVALMIVQAARHVGGPLKAWACYLLWLDQTSQHNRQLSPQARALALDQISAIPTDTVATAQALFHEAVGG
jgi:Ca-activated chloride channel family protein